MSGTFIPDIIIESPENFQKCRDIFISHLQRAKEGDFLLYKTSMGIYRGIMKTSFHSQAVKSKDGRDFYELNGQEFRSFKLQTNQLKKYALNEPSWQKALLQDINSKLIHILACDFDLTIRNGHPHHYQGTETMKIRNEKSIIPIFETAHQYGIWMPIISRSEKSKIKQFIDDQVEKNASLSILHKLNNSLEKIDEIIPVTVEQAEAKTWLLGHLIHNTFPNTSRQEDTLDLSANGIVVSCTLVDDVADEGIYPASKHIQFIHAEIEDDQFDSATELLGDNPNDHYLAELTSYLKRHDPNSNTFEIVRAETLGLVENKHFFPNINLKIDTFIAYLNSMIKEGKDMESGEYEETLDSFVSDFKKILKMHNDQISPNTNSATFFDNIAHSPKITNVEIDDVYTQQMKDLFAPVKELILVKNEKSEEEWQIPEDQWEKLITSSIAIVKDAKEEWQRQRDIFHTSEINTDSKNSPMSNINIAVNNEEIPAELNPNKLELTN